MNDNFGEYNIEEAIKYHMVITYDHGLHDYGHGTDVSKC